MIRLLLAACSAALFSAGCGNTDKVTPIENERGPEDVLAMVRQLNLPQLKQDDLSNPELRSKVEFIRAWLGNTQEIQIHRMRGAVGNKVYLAKDGHREAVYDANGDAVTGFNCGSYNFANPNDDPLSHFAVDILPWIELGMTRDDPTTADERTTAYLEDLRAGLDATLGGPIPVPLTDESLNEQGRNLTIAVFLAGFDETETDVLEFVGNPSEESTAAWFADFSEAMVTVLQQRAK